MPEPSRHQANPLFLREEELRQGIELLFYAYREAVAVAVEGFRKVLLGILDDENRRVVERELVGES